MSEAFARRLEEARAAACPGAPPRGTCFYRRAIASENRRARAAPPLPCPGLRLSGLDVAVLVAEDLPGGKLTRDAVDDALAAARDAGARWAAAWTDDAAEVAVLRDLQFQPLPHAEFTERSDDGTRS